MRKWNEEKCRRRFSGASLKTRLQETLEDMETESKRPGASFGAFSRRSWTWESDEREWGSGAKPLGGHWDWANAGSFLCWCWARSVCLLLYLIVANSLLFFVFCWGTRRDVVVEYSSVQARELEAWSVPRKSEIERVRKDGNEGDEKTLAYVAEWATEWKRENDASLLEPEEEKGKPDS